MNEIKPRQLCFFTASVLPVGKLLMLPSYLAKEAGSDLLISATISFCVQGIIIYLLLLLSEKTDKSFFSLLENTFGKIAAKTIYFFLALFFIFSSLLSSLENTAYVRSSFYDSFPSIIVFLPFFLFSAFACTKNMTAIGRSADIAMPLFAFSFFGILFMSVPSASFSSLLPFIENKVSHSLKGCLYTLNWFSDAAYILMFLGHFKGSKKTSVKVICSYVIGATAVVFFIAVFFGIFQSVALKQFFAIIKVPIYYHGISTVGRIDYIFTFIMAIVFLFYNVLPLQTATECLTEIFGEKRVLYSAIINSIMSVAVLILNNDITGIYDFTDKKIFFIFLIFAYLFPIAAVFLRRKDAKKQID